MTRAAILVYSTRHHLLLRYELLVDLHRVHTHIEEFLLE